VFARVVTAQAGPQGFDEIIALAERQLPKARQRPGFQGFNVLTNDETGNVMIISLWATREQMNDFSQGTASGVHNEGTRRRA
jgi:heme-degrading monooxygenase HmoA